MQVAANTEMISVRSQWQTSTSIGDNPMSYDFVTSEMPQSNTVCVCVYVFDIFIANLFVLGAAR